MQITKKNNIIYPELSYVVVGALLQVHNELGKFCNEKQYCDAVEAKLKERNIVYKREKILPPSFSNEQAGRNKIDFLIENKIVIEVKAKRFLLREDYYQTRRYLEALNKKLAILVNFQDKHLRPKRILNSRAKS